MTSQIRVLEAAYGWSCSYRGMPLSDGVGRPIGAAGNRDRLLLAQFGRDGRWRTCVLARRCLNWVLDGLDRCCRVYSGIDVSIEAGNSVRMLEVLQAYRWTRLRRRTG
ncbi:hypothetical protein [Ralstonia pseudosolanacearum]|uniref:hypothetical protein n=1 Tax=Ralstonia pseudosolanacearum TaxID=1310165 RepID=UPI001FFA971D|nr:hypothetical protein [Ralstonia pseudosolanacearum]